MRGRIKSSILYNEKVDRSMPWHIDSTGVPPVEAQFRLAEFPEFWESGVDAIWQNRSQLGREASTLFAPSTVIAQNIRNIFSADIEEIVANGVINSNQVELFRVLRLIFKTLKPKNPSSAETVMQLRDLYMKQVLSYCTIFNEIIDQITDSVTENAKDSTLTVKYNSEEHRNGVVTLYDSGNPNATERPIVHTRSKGSLKGGRLYIGKI